MNAFKNWLNETWVRLNADTPGYFRTLGRWLQWIAVSQVLLTNQFEALVIQATGMGLTLPDWASNISAGIALLCLGARFITGLPFDFFGVKTSKEVTALVKTEDPNMALVALAAIKKEVIKQADAAPTVRKDSERGN